MSHWAVVLAGGIGSRFWPLSTPDRPKQLLPLVEAVPMLRATLDRLGPLVVAERTLILTNRSLAEAVGGLAPEIPRENIVAEPRPAGTAAALTWAAAEIARRGGRESVMMSVHADWAIRDAEGFRDALGRAAEVAVEHHALVTVGIVPDRAETGFGYIRPGSPVGPAARGVAEFVEKPDPRRAEEMVREGCLWNSGIFVWRVCDFLDEVRQLAPEVAPALAGAAGDIDRFFGEARPVAVDVGVLERSRRVVVVPGTFGWDDVGTWASLRRVRALDDQGNACSGSVFAVQSRGNVVHAEDGDVVLYGVDNLVVVTRAGLSLVTTIERAGDLKALVESLPDDIRERP